LKKEQRIKLFDKIRVAFDLLTEKRKEYSKRKNEERIAKLEDSRKNFQQKLDRIETLLAKDKEILAGQKEKLEAAANNEQSQKHITQIIDTVNDRIKEREQTIKSTAKRIANMTKELEKIAISMQEGNNRKPKQNKEEIAAENHNENENTKVNNEENSNAEVEASNINSETTNPETENINPENSSEENN
jgi:uncharacterized coiled-coil protein SlyX